MSVRLVEITRKNLRETLELSVAENQVRFVASNALSIAQSKFYPLLSTSAVYKDDSMVGFVMYGYDEEEGRYTLIRLMIDQKFQGNGYGRSATEAVIQRLKDIEDCDAVYLSYVPANTGAGKLYESLGFQPTGEIDEGEIVMKYEISKDGQRKTDNG